MLIFWIPVTISELAFTLALSGDPACRPQKQLRPAPGLGLWIFCVCSEFVTRIEKSNSEPRTQFSAFYSGFRSQADYCLPALGISLSQNDNGTASTAHRK
jgi:hypothetical protein